MVRKAAISVEKLAELGSEKLARLVFDEAGRNAPFRKRISAALAAKKGPQSVAKIIDRRLGALEKARGFIDWDRERAFREDLGATVATTANELGGVAPDMAVDRLLRFLATHESVFGRVDDRRGHIEEVYEQAAEHVGELTPNLSQSDRVRLPERITTALGGSSYGYFVQTAQAVIAFLPDEVLTDWQSDLAARQKKQEAEDARSPDRYVLSNAHQYREVQQIIADRLGDLDGLIALEERKHPVHQDPIGVAKRLLEAGRLEEALDWVRRQPDGGLRHRSTADLADILTPQLIPSPARTSLEAGILEAMGDKAAAQSLRWSAFETGLNADMLKEYVNALPDFDEFEALDRAFAHVLASDNIHEALEFLVEWPRLDLAARKVMAHRREWNGRMYHSLPPVADALQHEHPLAATILYRSLIDDILTNARSKAYGHAARYLSNLDRLSDAAMEAADHSDVETHERYRAGLRKKHGRKSGFWSRVD